jgi:hypothetical protein
MANCHSGGNQHKLADFSNNVTTDTFLAVFLLVIFSSSMPIADGYMVLTIYLLLEMISRGCQLKQKKATFLYIIPLKEYTEDDV